MEAYAPSRMGTPLATSLAGIPLRNPVLLAAGTCGYLDELADVLDLARVGAVVTKSITRDPREGNPTWRIVDDRRHGGMLNAIGLANLGIDAFEREFGPRIAASRAPVIASVAGFSIDEYVGVAGRLGAIPGVAAVEVNVSCPNVHGGCEFGADPPLLRELVGALRNALPRTPMLVKLSTASMGSILALARAAIEGAGGSGGPQGRPGADALVIGNTVPAMAIDVRTRRPRLANVTGGFSGPAIHPIAVRLVHEVYRGLARDTRTPIVGLGGVQRWEDAAEFILAGADAVAMGTALFADPRSPLTVIGGLERWVRSQGCGTISELVGRVEL